jgi:hypothetical protein
VYLHILDESCYLAAMPIAGEVLPPVRVRREASASGQLLLLGLLAALIGVGIGVSFVAGAPLVMGVAAGCAVYLLYRRLFVPSVLLAAEHAGIAAVKREQYDEALACFLRSEQFFARHRWLDRWRGLIDASRHRHELLARHNRAACLAARDDVAGALELLDGIVAEAPDLELAVDLRKMLTAASS